MSKKSQRLAVIRNLIESEPVSSQEELLLHLRLVGIEATQSTLSRDMKEIKAVKVPDSERGYIYVMPESIQSEATQDRMSSIVTENILSMDFSGNISVIKTNPGYANAVAVMIDNGNYPEVMGTIAGDDNIFIVMHEGADRQRLIESLGSIHPGIGSLSNGRHAAANSSGVRRRILR